MKILSIVESLLKERQDFRDSDKKLLIAIWHLQGLHLTEEQREVFLNKCTTPETISRARRALKGEYPASKVVDDERYEKYKQYKYEGVAVI